MINKLPRLRKKVFDISQGPHRADQHLLRQVTKRERGEGTHRAAEGYRLLFDRNPAGVFRTLFEESTDGIAITTPGGEFILVNQAWLDLFGYTREEINELNIAETYVHAHDQTALRQRIEQRGSAKHYELKLRKKDGKQTDCLLAMKVWRAKDGSILGYQSIVQDITDRKQTEKSLRDLSGRLLCLQDEERRRLARELRHATGPSLAGLLENWRQRCFESYRRALPISIVTPEVQQPGLESCEMPPISRWKSVTKEMGCLPRFWRDPMGVVVAWGWA